MRTLAIIWTFIAALVAVVTTLLQVGPASYIIEVSSLSDGSFYLILPIGIIFTGLEIPLLLIMVFRNILYSRAQKIPADLSGKTGIVIQREKELTNAALLYQVLVNGEVKSKVAMGKSIFIELNPGMYTLQIKLGRKIFSPTVTVDIQSQQIKRFFTKTDLNKSLTKLVPGGEMLFLVEFQ